MSLTNTTEPVSESSLKFGNSWPNPLTPIIAANVRRWLYENAVSPSQLARGMGVAPSVIYKIIGGEGAIQWETRKRLIQATGISWTKLNEEDCQMELTEKMSAETRHRIYGIGIKKQDAYLPPSVLARYPEFFMVLAFLAGVAICVAYSMWAGN